MKRYVGIRTSPGGGAPVYVEDIVDGAPQNRRRLVHRLRHSPDGFQWGYGGSGPADLARSILWDHLGAEPMPACYQAFKAAVIARIVEDEWHLDGLAIDGWLDEWRELAAEPFATVDEREDFWRLDPEYGHLLGEVAP